MSGAPSPVEFDLAAGGVRSLNRSLHGIAPDGGDGGGAGGAPRWRIRNPGGRHALCVGMEAEAELEVFGHVGMDIVKFLKFCMRSFEIYSKWSVQTSIHTHAQCSYASVGLAQARHYHVL